MHRNRLPSGVPGLDKVLGGGFYEGSLILLSGIPGTGKTTFIMQSLFNAAKNNERCLYITSITEPLKKLIAFTSQFDFFEREHLDKKIVDLYDISDFLRNKSSTDLLEGLKTVIKSHTFSRIAIDPITSIKWGFEHEKDFRAALYDFMQIISESTAITYITDEADETTTLKTPQSYLADVIIILNFMYKETEPFRALRVHKMRGSDHSLRTHRYTISHMGLNVTVTPEITI
jgi:circadian clock protein KaiC